jgi:glycosyltransferase involved in cell wall biosynthesis
MHRPLVSIVIPCYNAVSHVRFAVLSALRQGYPRVEVVVVDDGSTDGSAGVLAEFGHRIKVITTPNRGQSHARNVGLEQAAGEYVQFLDADNVLTPDKVERSVARLAEAPDEDIVFTARYTPPAHDFTDEFTAPTEEAEACVRDMLRLAYERTFPGTGVPALETSQPLFRRAALTRYGGWDEQLTVLEDLELVARMVIRGAKVGHVPIVGVIYRDHPGDRVTNRVAFHSEAYYRTVLKMLDLAREGGPMTDAIEVYAANYLVWIAARMCIVERRFRHARRYLALARQIRPELPGPRPFQVMAGLVGPLPALAAVQLVLSVSAKLRIPLLTPEKLATGRQSRTLLRNVRRK